MIPDGDVARAVAYVIERGLASIVRTDAVRPPPAIYVLLGELRQAASVPVGRPGIPIEAPPVMVPSMSVSAAAELLRVSDRAVRALAGRGTLPGRQARRGAPWRFWADDVVAYAARREGVA